ncbi:MAG: flap endonuclease-1 [Candidatus Nanoarchaeia archaeon]|nr:flap endonuclease-1 [Candidatus Nanoarchaeia archaeon]
MGVNLRDIIPKEEIEIENLAGKKISIDAFNILYQFLSSIRQYDGTPLKDSKGRITSHISGLFYRTVNFVEAGIKPCFVFDGKAPEFKKATREERISRKEIAQEKYDKAEKEGDLERMKIYAQQLSRLTGDMIEESKELLDAMGLPYVQAPSEGEAQASDMVKQGMVYASSSQDYDSLLFGSGKLIRNLAISGRKKLPGKQAYMTVNPEFIDLKKVHEELKINQEQLILLGMLVGTDYNPGGVKGIGPKTALAMVKKYPTFELLVEQIDWDFENKPLEIFNFFKNPPVKEVTNITWKEPDSEKIKKILCDNHDFGIERVEKAIERISSSNKKGIQSNLFSFK